VTISVGIDKAVVSRIFVGGQKFEVLVDPDKALELKKGMKVDMGDILAYPGIYRDVRNTERVADSDLQKIFGTVDVFKIAERIIRQGDLQLTTEQRRAMVEQRKTQIAAIIAKKGVNPQTNTPHPPQRILNAMSQAGINVDPFVDAELQVDRVVKEIKVIIPLKFQNVTLQVKVPAQFAGKVYNVFKSSGTITGEQWLNDGSLQVNLTILAGIQDEFFQKLSGLTHGQYESKVLKREDI